MLKKLFFLIFFCLLYSQDSNGNILSSEITNESQAYKLEEGLDKNIFIIDIYCNNIDEIAGVQFELPDYFELLSVEEARTKDLNFEFHHNSKGLILGFSMSGDKILPSPNAINNSSTIYGNKVEQYKEDIICSFRIKYIPPTTKEAQINCPIKTILASPKGERLTFTSIESKVSLSKYDNPRQIKVSFYE